MKIHYPVRYLFFTYYVLNPLALVTVKIIRILLHIDRFINGRMWDLQQKCDETLVYGCFRRWSLTGQVPEDDRYKMYLQSLVLVIDENEDLDWKSPLMVDLFDGASKIEAHRRQDEAEEAFRDAN